ncbi:MAG: P-II family nitrogen regulator [Cytophagaceae bacterium]
MKKVEIIIESIFLDRIIKELDEIGVGGYTVIDIIKGKGQRGGVVKTYGITGVYKNSYMFAIVSDPEQKKIVDKVTPIIKELGGILICSEVTCFYA